MKITLSFYLINQLSFFYFILLLQCKFVNFLKTQQGKKSVILEGCPCWILRQEDNFLCNSHNPTENTHRLPAECIMERAVVVSARRTPSVPECNISTSTLAFDQHFTTNAKGILLLAEIVSVNLDFKMVSV